MVGGGGGGGRGKVQLLSYNSHREVQRPFLGLKFAI